MSIELKIKAKHLALEPSIIKREERKLKKQIDHYKVYHQITEDFHSDTVYKKHRELYGLHIKRLELISHRRRDVRNESRATELARAYIAGKPYSLVEKSRKEEMLFRHTIAPRVHKLVTKYGLYSTTLDQILNWSNLDKK